MPITQGKFSNCTKNIKIFCQPNGNHLTLSWGRESRCTQREIRLHPLAAAKLLCGTTWCHHRLTRAWIQPYDFLVSWASKAKICASVRNMSLCALGLLCGGLVL